ncbi:hypothetical protein [Streptosporangium sp. NPDC000396]|uniref:hypothetical protein n=1 Tax=Streptosporangium sp. NPDC000396 TaxID=3366185 RepID=UPI003691D6AC
MDSTERWFLRHGEPLGLGIAELPSLAAVVVTNLATNHWDLRALRMLPGKESTPVYVPTPRMARQARALGFWHAEHLRWGAGARDRARRVDAGGARGADSGAGVLIPVHDAHGRDPLSALFRTSGTASDTVALAGPGLRVVDLPTGERWEPAR